MQNKPRNSEEGDDSNSRGKKIDFKKLLIILVILAAIVAAGIYSYDKYMSSPERQLMQAAEETNEMISKLGKLMALPNATPTLFTIEDPAKISSNQPFFTGSVKGDVLFIYQETRKAIIYSPSRNIIVNVGPINFDTQSVNASTSAAVSPRAN